MTDLQAAIGRAQLATCRGGRGAVTSWSRRYDAALARLPGWPPDAASAKAGMPGTCTRCGCNQRAATSRDELIDELSRRGDRHARCTSSRCTSSSAYFRFSARRSARPCPSPTGRDRILSLPMHPASPTPTSDRRRAA